ncbi:hypothetical protein PTI45_01009 [Paenibacillus nuruki]|uniref:Uncharacterized protein n=1 Tax=Paenibacillus nuruki TaxID=1886670 RepID=A0A1E3L700_9BACL|nr:hypothetical protein [Paenibacillus nuruki]ODP29526.1 hypothetical protein PTI45_01009 [Paenibacillus nuruki]
MKDNAKKLIISGDFKGANSLIEKEGKDFLEQIVLELGFDEGSIGTYSFVCHLITVKESSDLHYLASELLSTALCHLPDAYSSALFHARRALELNSEDISLKEYLLLFHDIPEQLINKEEARDIARDIAHKSKYITVENSVKNDKEGDNTTPKIRLDADE